MNCPVTSETDVLTYKANITVSMGFLALQFCYLVLITVTYCSFSNSSATVVLGTYSVLRTVTYCRKGTVSQSPNKYNSIKKTLIDLSCI